jgi:membrane-associated PAP2 superfamily phosphatase
MLFTRTQCDTADTLINKKNLLYALPRSFYLYQALGLTICGAIFFWLSRTERLDRLLTGYWYDAASRSFPWRDNRWLALFNHQLLKDVIIAAAVILLLRGIFRRRPRATMVALLMGLGALSVGILKATSYHSCPWDLVEYGGQAVGYPLFDPVPLNSGSGHCFPGGHASSGFIVMGLFFLFYRERPRLAWGCFLGGIALGLTMGYGQVMRGAHFFSHNLWAGWWVWLTQVTVWWAVTRLQKKESV